MFVSKFFVNILLCIAYCRIFLYVIVAGEWIEMPQFSNEKKVYRIPSVKQEQFYKFAQNNAKTPFAYDRWNVYNNDMKVDNSSMNGNTEQVEVFRLRDPTDNPMLTFNIQPTKEIPPPVNIERHDETSDLPIIENEEPSNEFHNETLKAEGADIFEYLPIDLFERVHRILKSQPVSTEGKIQFLKTFEKTLMTEIESRMVSIMPGEREKRGADYYDHGYDDHDNHSVGFPSIEGALMAISFLTFAVYLVRLVMLLFRNINNVTPTTSAPTVFLGRRKRTAQQFNDDAADILSRIGNFASSLK